MRLLLTLAIFLLASTQLLSQTIDVTATIPDRFKNFFKTKEYDESPDISDYQRQRIITLQTPTPSIPDDQINAGDDVSLTYDGFYADANGNPSPYVNSVTQFIVSLELTGNDAHKYNLTNPTVSFAATIEQQILRSSSQPESVAFQRAFSEFTLTTQDIVVETDKFIDRDLGYYRLHADSVLVYSSPKGFAIYATKGQITTPKKIGSGRTIMIYYVYVGNPNYTLGITGQNYCTSCGSVVLPFVHFYIEPDSIVTYGTVITLHSIEADKGRDVGYTFTMGFKSATETGPSILHTQEANPIPAGKHILSAVSSKSSSYSQTITHFNVTILPRTLSLSSTPTLPSRLYDATTTLTKPSLPTLISTNLHPSDTIPTLSFTIDSSAVKPYPGTYPVLFHAHLSDPNYALSDSLFSVPFTIIAPPKQPLHASLVSTSAIYGDTLPISITPNIPGTLTTSPATPLPANIHSFNLHFLPQDTINYSTIDTTLSLTILPRTLSLSSSPSLPSRLYDATTTITTPSLPTLISTNLLPSDTIPALSFTIDSSAVKPYPGTYPVLFHAHLSNHNYALTDSLFSVPFTIIPRPKQSLHASLVSTSAIYGDTLPISITPNIPGALTTFPTSPLPTGNHALTIHFLPQDTLDYFPLDTILSLTILPRTLSLSSSPSLPSRPYDATTTLTTPSLPTLISTNLLPSDALPTISFTIDSSAVKPSPGTYHVLFHAHLSNHNYALTDSLFSVPFTITPRPKQSIHASLISTSAIYGDTLPISITPNIPGILTTFPTTPLPTGNHTLTIHFLPQDTLDYFPLDTILSLTILPRTLSLSSSPSLPSRPYDAATTLTTPSLPTLISTNLLPSDALPTISFSIDSSAVKPSPGTYPVLFHAHISNPNYALTDSLFSVPFTITVAHQPIPTLTTTSLPSLTKVYDGTTSLPIADPVSLSPYAQISSARFASSNVGDHSISVNIVSTDPYILFPNDSTVISNYPYPAQGTITPRPLSLVGEMSSPGKLYDATTIAPDSIINLPSISGVINNEDVRIIIQSSLFASKDATDNTILATISLSGADADNYTLPTTQISCPATISPLQLYATAPKFSSTSKEYDTSVATPSVISAPTPVGIIPSDDVTLYFTARYDSPNPGSRTIIVSYSLSGADAHNYLAPAPISIPSEITNPEPTPEPEPEPEPTPTPTPTPEPTPTPISASLVISNSNSSAPNDAFCPGEQLTLSLSVTSGEPVAFSLASSSPAIHDIPLSPIPDNFVIRIPITSSSSYGPASALLALFDSSRVATTQIPLSLTIRPDTSFVDFSYGNTLSISDPSRFTSFQWMSNNIPIPAATMPSYYANPLAPASYSCRITTPGGLSLQTCPLVINASPTAPISLSVTPSPVRTCSPLTVRLANAGQTLSVKVFDTYGNPQETHTVLNGAPFTITVDQGTYILLVSDGNTSAVSKILVK